MFVCNPWEPIGNTNYEAATQLIYDNDPANPDALQHRRMLRLRMDPGNSNQPGNYGFLASPLSNGLNAVRESIAKVQPEACFSRRGVTTQTGFGGQAIAQEFNVRFDIYDGSFNANKNDADYAPAANVRKGFTYTGGNGCTADLDGRAVALPEDTGFSSADTIGSGTWDFNNYWSIAHPTMRLPMAHCASARLPPMAGAMPIFPADIASIDMKSTMGCSTTNH